MIINGIVHAHRQPGVVQIFKRSDFRRRRLQQSDNICRVACVQKH